MDHVMNDSGATAAAPISVRAVGSSPPHPADEAASLSALWTELVSGFCKVEGTEFTEHTCAVIVTRGHHFSGSERSALPQRDIQILERSLFDGVRKSVAVDFGLCPSSIAEILRRCFAFMGLSCWPSRIPLLLVMAAYAKQASDPRRGPKLVLAQNPQFLRQTISAVRPDNELLSSLSPAEYAVTRLLIEGKSYQEMAALRETSKRTVANQLASAFHRLGISGRAELLCLLAKRKLVSWQTPASRPLAFPAAPRSTGFVQFAGARAR